MSSGDLAVVMVSALLDPSSALVQCGAADMATKGEGYRRLLLLSQTELKMIDDNGLSLSQS